MQKKIKTVYVKTRPEVLYKQAKVALDSLGTTVSLSASSSLGKTSK